MSDPAKAIRIGTMIKATEGEAAAGIAIETETGHPGVAEPHYHVTLWYVSPQEAAGLQ